MTAALRLRIARRPISGKPRITRRSLLRAHARGNLGHVLERAPRALHARSFRSTVTLGVQTCYGDEANLITALSPTPPPIRHLRQFLTNANYGPARHEVKTRRKKKQTPAFPKLNSRLEQKRKTYKIKWAGNNEDRPVYFDPSLAGCWLSGGEGGVMYMVLRRHGEARRSKGLRWCGCPRTYK